ncbi:MAG: LysR substrate-binding domain-containing protein [Methyloceanibacter sp.]
MLGSPLPEKPATGTVPQGRTRSVCKDQPSSQSIARFAVTHQQDWVYGGTLDSSSYEVSDRNRVYIGDRGANRVTLHPGFEINDAAAAIAAAEAGGGITNASSYMVAQPIREGRLVPVLLNLCPPAIPVQLVYPESRLVAPKVRAFIDYAAPRIRAALQEVRAREKATKAKS